MLKVLPPDPEIGWMDSKMVKLNCLTLGELENEPIFKIVACSFKISNKVADKMCPLCTVCGPEKCTVFHHKDIMQLCGEKSEKGVNNRSYIWVLTSVKGQMGEVLYWNNRLVKAHKTFHRPTIIHRTCRHCPPPSVFIRSVFDPFLCIWRCLLGPSVYS